MTTEITQPPVPQTGSFAVVKGAIGDPAIYHGVGYVQVEKGGELWLMGPGRSIIVLLAGHAWDEVYPVDSTGARIG